MVKVMLPQVLWIIFYFALLVCILFYTGGRPMTSVVHGMCVTLLLIHVSGACTACI